ncbi:hypothetical protein BGX26_010146 [Mortierella sp. AD094]|nr:hypothetical protein BGX26_010146 [Mortierella sp. AD094]
MITVPPREIVAFLGNHLDHVLQQTELDFAQNVAANRQFKAGCVLMDVLNVVESVQERIYAFLKERSKNNAGRENSGSSELAPSTPSELIAIALEVESKQVDLQFFEDCLPDVPIEEQIMLGQGWESVGQRRRGDNKEIWDSLNLLDKLEDCGSSSSNMDIDTADKNPLEAVHRLDFNSGIVDNKSTSTTNHALIQETIAEEEELEEWEIEAEKHFQGSEDVAPAPAISNTKSKKQVDVAVNRQQLNLIMEQASIQPLTFDQEQFMLSQFSADTAKVHIPLPPPEALPGIVDNNPTIAFNLLQYLIQLSSDLDGGDTGAQKSNGGGGGSGSGHIGKADAKDSSFSSPEPSIVDSYLYTMTHAKRLTLHSLEVVNRLSAATTLSPQFLHAYIENAIRCCELVEDKVGQARVVRMAITIPGYYHALQSFCVQFARVKEVANLFQSLVEYQREMDVPPPIQTQGPTIRGSQQPQQQLQQASRQQAQSVSMPSTPTTDTTQRSSWLASSGSISNVKSTLSKHTSLNGFSAPGALSQFIHPGLASPASSGSSSHQNGGGHSSSQSFSNGSSGGSHFKTHHKHSSQHSSGSLFSSPTVMSASVNAFNTGLGNPTNLTLNGGSSGGNGQGPGQLGSHRSRSGSTVPTSSTSAPNSASASDSSYDLDAALRASLKDMETRSGSSSSLGGSPGSGSNASRITSNGQQQQQQQQQQQTAHLGPKGLNNLSHLGNQARGRGARRGG